MTGTVRVRSKSHDPSHQPSRILNSLGLMDERVSLLMCGLLPKTQSGQIVFENVVLPDSQ